MNKPVKREDALPIASSINLELVRNVADSGSEEGLDTVEAFHKALFLNEHGRELEHCRQQRLLAEDRLRNLESRRAYTRGKLAGEEQLVPVLENGSPDTQPTALWNFWDASMFVVSALGVLCLLLFGVFNVSFNLLESGIVTFADHPIRAYFWSALLPVGALAVKVGWDLLTNRRLRGAYQWACLGMGLVSVLVWVAAYASMYPSLSMTTEERIASLQVSGSLHAGGNPLPHLTPGGVKWVDMILVGAQALAEICLSAALGIYMTQLYTRHRPVRLARNPVFAQFDQESRALDDAISRERLALAQARGNEARIENQLSALVTYARTMFEKEEALRRDRTHQKRQILDEIAEQLTSRLAAVDGDGKPGPNRDTSRLALDFRAS